jgi:hypothetical protein
MPEEKLAFLSSFAHRPQRNLETYEIIKNYTHRTYISEIIFEKN